MKLIQKNITAQLNYSFGCHYHLEDMVFFDIETTGFSADISSVYLIGCVYFQGNDWKLIQWFADDYISEADMIQGFFQFLQNFKLLIHYNGTGFDLPYLLKKCLQYQLNFDFSHIESLDLYKKLQPYKKYLPLSNLKLKTVESLLNIPRKDCYDGGELIQLYSQYINGIFLKNPEIETHLHYLLLHNEEDIVNLLYLTEILSYYDLINGKGTITSSTFDTQRVTIQFNLSNPVPVPITIEKESIILNANKQNAVLTIPLYEGELKFFFDHYQDYFYLIKEDIAVHKSVAIYVEKEYRTKAKASNCYIKKTGLFAPQYGENLKPYLKKDYKDKVTYLEIDDDFFHNQENLKQYTFNILQFLIK